MKIGQTILHPVFRYTIAWMLLLGHVAVILFGIYHWRLFEGIYLLKMDEMDFRIPVVLQYGMDWEWRWINECMDAILLAALLAMCGLAFIANIVYLSKRIYSDDWRPGQFGYRKICLRGALLVVINIGVFFIARNIEHFQFIAFAVFLAIILLLLSTLPIIIFEALLRWCSVRDSKGSATAC